MNPLALLPYLPTAAAVVGVISGTVTVLLRVVQGYRHVRQQRMQKVSIVSNGKVEASRAAEAPAHNLPLQTTRLLGREREVAAAREQLLRDEVRLLTLTGPGGTGKTRLGLHVASELLEQFAEGVFFVALAPIAEPGLVAATIAQTVGIRDMGVRPVLDTLSEYLRPKQVLLLLDNFEQVLPAAPVVDGLLRAAPRLKVLVTSRAPLDIRGEHEFPVPPLGLPNPLRETTIESLSQYGAVALFVDRAQAIRPDFSVTSDNAAVVAEICIRLDGLPLAIELAAAHIRLLSPQAMLGRLEHRLPLLTGGAQDLPARQRTLRGAISWSYDLLGQREQALFRRLAIFVGGCTLEAAEQVADTAGLGLDMLDGAGSLVAKSLVRREEGSDGEPRLVMLETVREYGLEQLQANNEEDATRQRHAAYYLALAEHAELKLLGAEQVEWLGRLATEHDNIRAVLAWSRDGQLAADVGLRLSGALEMFWSLRGFAREARNWSEAILALPDAKALTPARARALYAAARAALQQSDSKMSEFARASIDIFREVGNVEGLAHSLAVLAGSNILACNYDVARSQLEESSRLAERVGDQWGLAFATGQLAAVAQFQGAVGEARALREKSANLAREIGDRYTLGLALAGLAILARESGNNQESSVLFKESLTVSRELGDHWVLPRALAGLAGSARLAANYARSARLFGAVEAMREADGTREHTQWREVFDAELEQLRGELGQAAFEKLWAEGRSMSPEQAVAYALAG